MKEFITDMKKLIKTNPEVMPELQTAMIRKYQRMDVANPLIGQVFSKYEWRMGEDIAEAVTPEVLGTIFELTHDKRKESGSFYTPKVIVDYMCNEAIKQYLFTNGVSDTYAQKEEVVDLLDEVRIIDIACGCGAFQVGMLKAMLAVYDEIDVAKDPIAIIENNIFGADINAEAIEIAKLRLKFASGWWIDKPIKFNFTVQDSLLTDMEADYDIAIGNPPYVQIQKFTGQQCQKDWKNKFEAYARTGDMYCLFMEKSVKLLKSGGVLSYLTSNKWMRALYGKEIRGFLADNTNPLKLIDFDGVKVFDGATVNVSILLATRK